MDDRAVRAVDVDGTGLGQDQSRGDREDGRSRGRSLASRPDRAAASANRAPLIRSASPKPTSMGAYTATGGGGRSRIASGLAVCSLLWCFFLHLRFLASAARECL